MYGESAANDAIVGISKSANHSGIVGVNYSGGYAAYFEAGSSVCNFKSGTSGWACSSDRALKENFKPINPVQILDALAKMPITTWSMKGSKIRQLGPTAQDFKSAFGLGNSDKSINNTDAQGVALAAIQGLNQKLEAEAVQRSNLEAENTNLKARITKLENQLASLKATEERLARLEQVLSTATK